MVQALLCGGLVVVSFTAAAALVLAIARRTARHDTTAGTDRPERTDLPVPVASRAASAGEPAWWPEFERAFADYVHHSAAGSRDWKRRWRSRR
jgi:hypothetical protein